MYLAKRVKLECLTAVAYLATRVTRCSEDDVDKLYRLVRYIRWARDTGLLLRPGSSGLMVRLFVDACGSSGSKVPILPDSTTVHYPPYTTVCCIVVAFYSLHVEVKPSF